MYRDGARAVGVGVRGRGGAPHDLVLALLLLALPQHDALDDGALLGREVRQVRHVVHGGRAPPAGRGPAACCGAVPARDTPLGGLFNNAGRTNGAPPCNDVRRLIDRGGRARRAAHRYTTYMRAHINYATTYVHILTSILRSC